MNNIVTPNAKKVMMNKELEVKYNDLLKEFEQYKRESVKWGIEDFTEYNHDKYTITPEKAQEALEHMIYKHAASIGITWDTIEYYLSEHGTLK